jgi:hypothetical protein
MCQKGMTFETLFSLFILSQKGPLISFSGLWHTRNKKGIKLDAFNTCKLKNPFAGRKKGFWKLVKTGANT